MARKRLNKKFAILLLATAGSAVVVGGVAFKVMRRRESPAKYAALVQADLAQGNLVGAFENQRLYTTLAPSPEGLVRQGELAKQASAQDPDIAKLVRVAFEQALEMDPKNVPALQGMTQWYLEYISLNPRAAPADYTRLRDLARTTAGLDPTDKRAVALVPASSIMAWMNAVDIPVETVDAAGKELAEVVAKDPLDSESLGVLTNYYMRKSLVVKRANRPDESAAFIKLAVDAMHTSMKAAEVSLTGATTQPSGASAPASTQPSAEDEKRDIRALAIFFRGVTVFSSLRLVDTANSAAHARDLQLAIDASQKLARPNRPWFREINYNLANVALMRGDRPGADAVYQKLLEQTPNDLTARMMYARFLRSDPATIDQSIEVLARPVTGRTSRSDTFANVLIAQEEKATRSMLVEFRLDAAELYNKPEDAIKRKALIDAASADVQKMYSETAGASNLAAANALALMGRVEMARGSTVPAIGYFTRSRTMFDGQPGRRGADYWVLLRQLGSAYIKSGQTGVARQVLNDVVTQHPEDTAARILLIELSRQTGDMEGAKRQLEAARKQIADAKKAEPGRIDPYEKALNQIDAIFKTATLLTQPNADGKASAVPTKESMDSYNALPEMTRVERLAKASFAMNARFYPEAARLLGLVYAENQKDVSVAVMLVQAQVADKKPEEAKATLKVAREAQPDNLQLKLFELQLGGASQADLKAAILADINKTPDEFERDMKLYDFYITTDRAQAVEFLKKAAALKPSDLKVNDRLFQNALADRKLDEAEKYLPVLAAGNADEVKGKLFRFQLLSAQGKTDEALVVATELSQEYAQFAESWNTLATAQMAKGNVDGANRSYAQTLVRQPNNVRALKGLIQTNYMLGRTAEAGRVINDALRFNAQDEELIEMKIMYELSYGDTEKGLKAMDTIAAAAPAERADIRAKVGVAYSQAASVAATKGDLPTAHARADKAIASFDAVLAALPAPSAVANMTAEQRARVPDVASIMSHAARAALLATTTAPAEALLKRTIDNLPSDAAEPVMILAEFYGSINKAAESEAAAREGVRRGGGATVPRRSAAMLLARFDKVDDAIAMLDGIADTEQKRQTTPQRVEMLMRAKRADEAEKIARASLVSQPNDTAMQVMLAAMLVETARLEEAGRLLTDILARDPSNVTAIYYRARVQMGLPAGDLQAAIRDLLVVRDRGNMGEDRRRWLIEAYRRVGDIEAVGREAKVILNTNPENRQLRMQLVDAYLRVTPPNLTEAATLVDEGLKLPSLANDADLLMVKARIALERKDFNTAAVAARAAVDASGRNPRALSEYLNLLVSAKMPKLVLTESDPLIAAGTRDFLVYIARGGAKKQLGESAGAVSDYITALTLAAESDRSGQASKQTAASMGQTLGVDAAIQGLAPQLDTNVQNRVSTALLYQTQNRMAEALAVLEPALARVDSLQPLEKVVVLRESGAMLVTPGKQQNFPRSLQVYRKLIVLEPNDVSTLNNLAYILSEKTEPPNLTEAKQYSTRAVQVLAQSNQLDPLILDTHGWVLVLTGEVKEGILVLSKAAELRSFVEVHYHLAEAYRRNSMPEQALAEAKRAQAALARPGADQSYQPKITELMKLASDELAKQGISPR